ncbi:DNA-deoxyinosine glycosylase [Burkholderia glumae]|uniref:DNA-deoxyinosine glycosylase n=1 Tax=Burkholderia glumae TaxID=337 RepID=A0AAQ0BUV4_BURGL|nr:DNA-deoxyinosine glycosylase [Burkholderia glumae]ACR29754.1 Uracil-DNA glycosylase superfamily [Burkholderia glumae BGR1]AJY65441.1 DNA-deoxyinosine glycosylase [Burkholderia glumae LMG 2196 = ATCC 33617]KHJ60188.1 DNA glycosylase [Burkholderia glumae]MCM2482577.1 DNA-deoxyinosine glycosylase [Burkholderia glumae]MCM2490781.1 DNA-deoxyinosine glycosylase [Burkholderia glumae]
MTLKRSFAPVVDAQTRVLILGSLPGEVSLAQSQYYAHPQNRFWRLLGDVLGTELVALDYASRLDTLLRHRIGLWDVVAEATRIGSLDSRIRDHASNDLSALVDTLPNLDTIAFNGGTAAKLGTRALAERGARYRLLRLPSSSPAYAALPYADKLLAWRQLLLA